MTLGRRDVDRVEERNLVFQKVGRNVVNFQRMERALKVLIVRNDIQGHASELAEIYRQRQESVDRRSMGLLVDDLMNSIYGTHTSTVGSPEELKEAWLSFSFKVEANEQAIVAQRKALSLVVKERNALIHQMLSVFDPDSSESCQCLISALDEQNARLEPHYVWLMRMVGRVKGAQLEAIDQIEAILRSPVEGDGDAD